MNRTKSFSLVVLLISLLLISCGKKEDKEEYIDEKPVKTAPDNTENKTEQLKNDTTKQNRTSPTDINKEKPTGTYEHEFHPVANVSVLEAGDYTGKEITANGFVADVYKNDKVAYLNFVEKYPNNPFTAVIFANKFSEFGNIDKYEGANVEVTGRVSSFKGKPQMILDSPKQIKVIK